MTATTQQRPAPVGDAIERLFGPWPMQLGWLLLVALVTRWTVFGDSNYDSDETLYFLVGQKMLDGYLPYVDIWDRKGPGLFSLYAVFAAISPSVLSYQIAALVFATLTAFLICRIAQLYTGLLGSLFAGTFYLALLPRLMGGGGQAGVFFNLLVVLAAWLVLSRPVGKLATWRAMVAMLLCGMAITFKQACAFDGAFLGLLLLWRHHAAGATTGRLMGNAVIYMALGALPMVAWGALYAVLGHFAEFWHAMVLSNLAKTYDPGGNNLLRIGLLLLILAPLLPFSVAGLARRFAWRGRTADRGVLAGWLVAVLLALVAVPNFFDHYALPVIVVLALCAAPALQSEPKGALGGVLALALVLGFGGPQFNRAQRLESRHAIDRLTAQITSRPDARLFVFQGPVALYSTTGQLPPTPLLFPLHLSGISERNVSQFNTVAQVRRVLDWQPTTVVVSHEPRKLANRETQALVLAYVRDRCRSMKTWNLPNRYGKRYFDVWSDCEPAGAPG